ncbi:MAG: methyl-accepting chemotaxis protein [Fibrobacter sp.]|nr:methyl-accepting chemotaxis protein [Fibrobacter sp.]
MWNRLKIRFKLLIPISILLTLATISVGYLASSASKDVLVDISLSNMSTTARQAASTVEHRLKTHEEEMRGIARIQDIRAQNWSKIPQLLTQVSKDYSYLALAVVDAKRTAHYQDGSNTDLSNHEYIEKAFKGEANTSDIIISRVTNSAVIMVAAPIYSLSEPNKVEAVIIGRLPAMWISEMTDGIQFIKGSYAYIVDKRGGVIAHANRDYVMDQRNFMEEGKTKPEFASLGNAISQMISGELGTTVYNFMDTTRLMAYAPIPSKQWSIGIIAEQEVLDAEINKVVKSIAGATVLILIIGLILVIIMGRIITQPIINLTAMLKDIAQGEGDLTRRINIANQDEIGELAKWFNTFIEKVQNIIREIANNTTSLSSSSEELSAVSNQIAASAEEMTAQSNTVASATEQSSVNLNSISSASEQVSASVSTMASAIEELNASMREVENQCKEEVGAVQQANSEVRTTREVMQKLQSAADSIGKVIEIINKIAAQTNLLALNATIEAASAGEAGKGFAVVASEVKDLARQTANATQEIAAQIQDIQDNTAVAAQATDRFTTVIDQIHHISQSILVSINEQTSTVREIAQNVNGINAGTQDTARNVAESAQGLTEVSRNIAGVSQAANDTSQGVQQVRMSAEELAKLAHGLATIVRQFRI